jgi:hypothetical protein
MIKTYICIFPVNGNVESNFLASLVKVQTFLFDALVQEKI